MKKFAVLFCCVCSVFCVLISGCSQGIERYEKDRINYPYAERFMPELDKLGEYSEITYHHKDPWGAFTLMLFVTYDEENYVEQKQIAENSYTFLEEPVVDFRGNYVMPVTQFELNGFDFKITNVDSDGLEFACKSFGLLGVNDEQNELCYAYFYDGDLDWICEADKDPEEAMIKLVKKYFKWK